MAGDRELETAGCGQDVATAEHVAAAIARIVGRAAAELGSGRAGVTLLTPGGRLASVGVTDPAVTQADVWQYRLDEGPCLYLDGAAFTLCSVDVAIDERWPGWGPKAAGLGLTSMLSAYLNTRTRRVGALTFYSGSHRTFTAAEAATAHLAAIHATVVLRAVRADRQPGTELESRTQIEQAQGVLMERFGIDAGTAWIVLSRYSQSTDTDIGRVACRLLATRRVPFRDRDDR